MESYGRIVDNEKYINILKVLRDNGGPYNWIRETKNFAKNTSEFHTTDIGRNKAIKEVLSSYSVKNTIREVALKNNQDVENVTQDANDILYNMAQNFNLTVVRIVGYTLMKIFDVVLDGVYINNKEMEILKELIKENPIVFMPTHKSYLDFLLLSIVCYDQNITLPCIAAGMDFQNSAFIGETLRLCGAFFLKRSFGNDKLYWSIFSEYVKVQIRYPDRPMEYFVEGTRSRTQKSLFPKYGLLQMVIEPFLKNNVYDIQIVPVSINYDRVMEEILYGYELLGFPKPKESTSSLFEARSILKERYGNVYITFGNPISTRNFFGTRLDRLNISSSPNQCTNFNNDVRKQIRELAHVIIKKHNENSISTIFPIISFSILQIWNENISNEKLSIKYNDLLKRVIMYWELFKKLKINTYHQHATINLEVRYQISLHKNLFSNIEIDGYDSFEITLSEFNIDKEVQRKNLIPHNSVVHIVLQNYANQLAHHFVDMGIIGTIFCIDNSTDNDNVCILGYEEVYQKYVRYKELLRYEFVYVPGEEKNDFQKALKRLEMIRICSINKNIIINDITQLKLITKIIESFIHGFINVTKIIKQISGQCLTDKELLTICQLHIGKEVISKTYMYTQNVSADFIKNVINSLKHQHIIVKKDNIKNEMFINSNGINELIKFFKSSKYFKKYVLEEIIYESNTFIVSKI
uniref:PlsC domain-containing protein n=1 Tax=Parastrongyloides trichosuri TaxID=131310 RepID=A0A0N4ZB31_PARTI